MKDSDKRRQYDIFPGHQNKEKTHKIVRELIHMLTCRRILPSRRVHPHTCIHKHSHSLQPAALTKPEMTVARITGAQGRGHHHRETGARGSNLTACLIEAPDSMTSPICMRGEKNPLGIIKPLPGQASKARTTCSCLTGEHSSQTDFRGMERLETRLNIVL